MQMKLTISCLLALIISTVSAEPIDATKRIVGGSVIHIASAPYNVQLRLTDQGTVCGGALVSTSHVLTAAHCFIGVTIDMLTIVAGANLVNDVGVQRRAVRVNIHPEYSPETMFCDAAVIKTDAPVVGPNIAPVNLCSGPLSEGDFLDVTGWGRMEEEGPMSMQLRHARYPINPIQLCVKEFNMLVQKNMFCASGYEAKGICFGDSGGPGLVRGEVCGINSFGNKCGTPGFQSVYTYVYGVRSFIDQAMSY